MALSVGRYANCSGSSVGGSRFLMCLIKELHDDECECNGPVVIEAGHCGILWHRDDSGSLETCRNNGAVRGCVKDVSEDISQLVCTSSEHFAQNVVWSRSFSWVNFAQSLLYIICGETQYLIIRRRDELPRNGVILCLKMCVRSHSAHLRGRHHCLRQVVLACSWCWFGCIATYAGCHCSPWTGCGFSGSVRALLLWWPETVWPILFLVLPYRPLWR